MKPQAQPKKPKKDKRKRDRRAHQSMPRPIWPSDQRRGLPVENLRTSCSEGMDARGYEKGEKNNLHRKANEGKKKNQTYSTEQTRPNSQTHKHLFDEHFDSLVIEVAATNSNKLLELKRFMRILELRTVYLFASN